jgi:hypothetical protein
VEGSLSELIVTAGAPEIMETEGFMRERKIISKIESPSSEEREYVSRCSTRICGNPREHGSTLCD